ncbi:MAG: hypothetical protein ACI835_003840 [Planctomycetota bacterium]
MVPGIEVSSRDGHIGGLFITNKIPPNLSAKETVARIHAADGLADAHRTALVGKGRTYFAGNLGVSSLKSGIEHGLSLGSEGYRTLSEKFMYRITLAKAILKNTFTQQGSVN